FATGYQNPGSRIRDYSAERDPHWGRDRTPRRRRPDGARGRVSSGPRWRVAPSWRRYLAAANLGLPSQMGKPYAAGLDQVRDARAESVAPRFGALGRR